MTPLANTKVFSSSWEILPEETSDEITVKLNGKFTYADLPTFRTYAKKHIVASPKSVHLCLRELSFLDSPALGTLVWLRELLNAQGKTLRTSEANWKVKQVLEITKLDQLLNLS